MLAAGKPDREIKVLDVATESEATTLGKLEMLSSVEQCMFTPSGTRLIAGGQSGHITIFSATKEGRLKEHGQFAGHSKEITCIAISSDSKLALTGSSERKARLWDIEKGTEIGLISGFEGKIKAVHISKTGRVGMATDGKLMQEFELTSTMKIKRTREFTRSWASGQAAAFSPDGQTAAVGDGSDIRLFALATGKELDKLEGGEIQWTMAFAPDSIKLLSGAADKVNIWNVKQQKRIHAQSIPNSGYIHALAVSPDNKHAAGAGRSAVHVFKIP